MPSRCSVSWSMLPVTARSWSFETRESPRAMREPATRYGSSASELSTDLIVCHRTSTFSRRLNNPGWSFRPTCPRWPSTTKPLRFGQRRVLSGGRFCWQGRSSSSWLILATAGFEKKWLKTMPTGVRLRGTRAGEARVLLELTASGQAVELLPTRPAFQPASG